MRVKYNYCSKCKKVFYVGIASSQRNRFPCAVTPRKVSNICLQQSNGTQAEYLPAEPHLCPFFGLSQAEKIRTSAGVQRLTYSFRRPVCQNSEWDDKMRQKNRQLKLLHVADKTSSKYRKLSIWIMQIEHMTHRNCERCFPETKLRIKTQEKSP